MSYHDYAMGLTITGNIMVPVRVALGDRVLVRERLHDSGLFCGVVGEVSPAGHARILCDDDIVRWAAMNAIVEVLPRAQATAERVCEWSVDEDGWYATECGHLWSFIDGGPKENHAVFCLCCGGRIALFDVPMTDDGEEGEEGE